MKNASTKDEEPTQEQEDAEPGESFDEIHAEEEDMMAEEAATDL